MGKTSNQRRAALMRRLAQQQRSDGAPSQSHDPSALTQAAIEQLITTAAWNSYGREDAKAIFDLIVTTLAAAEANPSSLVRPTAVIASMLLGNVSRLYEQGWQPADIAHVVKRQGTVRSGRLIVSLIAHEARGCDAVGRAPHAWLAQLDDLGAYDPDRGTIIGGHDQPFAAWARVEHLDPDEMLAGGLQVLAVLIPAPRLHALLTPPSRWGATNRGVMPTAAVRSGEVDAKALKLIRALLAKAEGTTFEAEAEAFTAKAQEMMTRYSIDAAVLASTAVLSGGNGRTAGVESRRVHIDSPYADDKAGLLSVIATVNGARCIWAPGIGIATIMGFPVDLQLTDMLFTSLLVQATRASAEATSVDRRLRTASFRRAFLMAFASRIGERLEATRRTASAEAAQQYGSSLVPILADRQAAVEEAFAESFPNVTTPSARRVNAAGWHAGRAAADRAHISAGEAIDAGSG